MSNPYVNQAGVEGPICPICGKKGFHNCKPEALTFAEQNQCPKCGEDNCSPNVEAFEISGEIICDGCAEEVFEDNGQFGVGA